MTFSRSDNSVQTETFSLKGVVLVSESKSQHFILLPTEDEKLRAMLEQKLVEYKKRTEQDGFKYTHPVLAMSLSRRYRDAYYKIAFLELLLKTGRVDGLKLLFEMTKLLGSNNFSLPDFENAEGVISSYVNGSLKLTTTELKFHL